ncbi:hypothetical protein L484_009231 [Morus notabilis]|uniref:Uncharacterized protein n=1 Tax=Morus notabilis TaxID=981085 RepID=W9S373_9ROSA|nr:hypothetical protein L484_009231 [Morus notabilis]
MKDFEKNMVNVIEHVKEPDKACRVHLEPTKASNEYAAIASNYCQGRMVKFEDPGKESSGPWQIRFYHTDVSGRREDKIPTDQQAWNKHKFAWGWSIDDIFKGRI